MRASGDREWQQHTEGNYRAGGEWQVSEMTGKTGKPAVLAVWLMWCSKERLLLKMQMCGKGEKLELWMGRQVVSGFSERFGTDDDHIRFITI